MAVNCAGLEGAQLASRWEEELSREGKGYGEEEEVDDIILRAKRRNVVELTDRKGVEEEEEKSVAKEAEWTCNEMDRDVEMEPEMNPTIGITTIVKGSIDYAVNDDENPKGLTYLIPRPNGTVLLGGAAVRVEGREWEKWRERREKKGTRKNSGEVCSSRNLFSDSFANYPISPALCTLFREMEERCLSLVPALREAPVLARRAALRPSRRRYVDLYPSLKNLFLEIS